MEESPSGAGSHKRTRPVEAAGAADAQTRPPRLGKHCAFSPSFHRALPHHKHTQRKTRKSTGHWASWSPFSQFRTHMNFRRALYVAAHVLAPSSEALDTPLGPPRSLAVPGVCYSALRRLPRLDSHPLETNSVKQTSASASSRRERGRSYPRPCRKTAWLQVGPPFKPCMRISRVYPGFPTIFRGLSEFFVGDLMGKALVEARGKRTAFSKARWARSVRPRPVSFHRARPCATKWSPRGGIANWTAGVLGLRSTRE